MVTIRRMAASDLPESGIGRIIPSISRHDVKQAFRKRITLAYLVKDDVDLMTQVVQYYDQLGIRLVIILDAKSDQTTQDAYERMRVRFFVVQNDASFVEPMHEMAGELIDTEWLLFMNSDELLNYAGLVFAARASRESFDCLGIARRWVMQSDGAFAYSGSSEIGLDVQWRLIRPHAITFHGKIHTCGFDLPRETAVLPEAGCIYHFDWVCRDYRYRCTKLRHYDEVMPGAYEKYHHWYLPEDDPSSHPLVPLSEEGFFPLMPSLNTLNVK